VPDSRDKQQPSRWRVLVRLGIAVLVLTIFVGAPAYLGSQPEFFSRFSALGAQYIPWQTSVHAKVSCQSCHTDPGLVSQGGYSLRMLGEFYVTRLLPSRQVDVFNTPTNAACESCHADLRTVSPSGDLNIPHRAHVDVLEIECVTCHEFLVHELSPEGSHTPTMAGCLTCHDGKQAKNACSTCHTEKAAPENHTSPEWAATHAEKQGEIDCAECHAWVENWCAECHSRRPRSHSDTWRSEHGARVTVRRNCEVCHEGEQCIRCHGEVPTLNLDPTLALVE